MKTRQEMKLLFVNPCIRRNAPTKILPVGLGSVMTYVHENEYRFDLLDIDINEFEDDYVENHIRDTQYDVILVGSIVTHYKWIKWFVKTIKKHHPETQVVVGNSVSGSVYQVFLQNVPADVVVIGEGELTALDALDALRTGRDLAEVEGIAYRRADGEIVSTERRKAFKIDDFPMINWDFFDVKRYIEKSAHYLSWGVDGEKEQLTIAMPVSTARGCAFKCTFCHYVFWDDPYRHRSAEGIMAEIRRNIEKYGANYINFWDDLSFSNLIQVEKVSDAILESGLKFGWMAAIRSDLFGNPKIPYERRIEIAKKMKRAGCLSVGFSLESGNREILAMMDKKIQPEYFLDQVKILREVGIVCNTSVVFGYPIETRETIMETFDFCLRAGVYPSIGFLLPLPYTGMYDYAKEHGFIKDEDAYLEGITERQDICLNMTKLSDEEIMTGIKEGARLLNEALDLGLTEDRLVRTGGYKKQTNLANAWKLLDPENVKRNENDFSFNYSDSVFEVDGGSIEEVSVIQKDAC